MGEDFNRNELAKQCDAVISEAVVGLNKHSMVVGWYGRILKANNLFAELGYPDEHVYRKSKGVGRSTWYRMVRIAESFTQLSAEEFCSMVIENAEMLADLPEEQRYEKVLLTKAASETAEQYEETLVMYRAKRQHRRADDMTVTWKLRMNRLQKRVLQEKLEQWQREHDIDDEAYALELLVAENTDRLTLVGYFSETISRLKRTVDNNDLHNLREELRRLISEMQEALVLVVGENPDRLEEVA